MSAKKIQLGTDPTENYPQFKGWLPRRTEEEAYISPLEFKSPKGRLPNPSSANKEKIRFPIAVKKLVSCPVGVMYKKMGSERFYPGKEKLKATAFIGVDKRKRLFFQIGLIIPGGTYIKLTISKYYLYEMIKYHLKLKPIPSQDSSKLWFHNLKVARELQSEDLDSIDSDRILDDYLSAVTNMESVVNHPCNKHKEEAHQQYMGLLALEERIKNWAYIQACRKYNLIPDPEEYDGISSYAKNITAFKHGLKGIKGLNLWTNKDTSRIFRK